MAWLKVSDLKKDPNDLRDGFLHEDYIIQNEFLSSYELTHILFDNFIMKPKQKDIGYVLVRMIYDDIDWQLYKERVYEEFERIWNYIGFEKDREFPIFDLRSKQFIHLVKNVNRRIFNDIYLSMMRLISTNLYKENDEKSYDEKVNIFSKFIIDFNTELGKTIKTYASEISAQLLIIKLMIGTNRMTIAGFNYRIKKAIKLIGKNLNPTNKHGYREVFRRNDEYKEEHGKNNYRKICFDVAKDTLDLIHKKEQENFNRAFNKIKRNNKLTNSKEFENFLYIIENFF